jgi:predicted nucleic acid-binding Zn ribbon protein
MSERRHTDQPLKALIQEMLKKGGMDKKYTELEVVKVYREVVGAMVSRHTPQVFVRGKKLILKPDSGVIKSELNYAKASLLETINERLGFPFIEEIEIW